jgi:hypothetical protein
MSIATKPLHPASWTALTAGLSAGMTSTIREILTTVMIMTFFKELCLSKTVDRGNTNAQEVADMIKQYRPREQLSVYLLMQSDQSTSHLWRGKKLMHRRLVEMPK